MSLVFLMTRQTDIDSQNVTIQVPRETDIRLTCTRLKLTPRETDIVCHAMVGKRRADIARELCIAPTTIDYYWKEICCKLSLSSRRDVAQRIWQEIYQPSN